MKKVILFISVLLLFCSQKIVDYYPLFAGSIRVYEINRILIIGKDTSHLVLKQTTKVMGKATHDYWDEVWAVNSQESGSPPVTAYIKKTNSEIRLTPTLKETMGEMKQLVLPLTIGNSWVVAASPTETLFGKVLSIERVKVPIGEFESCYKVEIKTKDATLNRFQWLVPNIGIVKNEIRSKSIQNQKEKIIFETSILIQYNTKPTKE